MLDDARVVRGVQRKGRHLSGARVLVKGSGGVGSAYSGLAFVEAVLGMAHAAFVEPSSRPHVECGQALPTRLLDKRTREVGLAAAGEAETYCRISIAWRKNEIFPNFG